MPVDGGGEFKWRVSFHIILTLTGRQGFIAHRLPIAWAMFTSAPGNYALLWHLCRWQYIVGARISDRGFGVITAGMAPLIAEDGLMYIVDSSNLLCAYADPEVYPLLFTDVQVVEGTGSARYRAIHQFSAR